MGGLVPDHPNSEIKSGIVVLWCIVPKYRAQWPDIRRCLGLPCGCALERLNQRVPEKGFVKNATHPEASATSRTQTSPDRSDNLT